jgi:hypothetical protein
MNEKKQMTMENDAIKGNRKVWENITVYLQL